MKRFFKIGCLGLIGIFVLLLIIGMMADDSTTPTAENNEETASVESEPTQESSTPATQEEVETEVTPTATLGMPKRVGDATFTVNSVNTAKEVGSQYLNSQAQGTYLVVNVTYENNENESTTVDTSFFKLKYGEKTYDSDGTASLYANSQDDGSTVFLLEQVNPDMSVTGDIIFDVTDEVANATGLQLQVQTGFFGTETGLITIQ